jgi:hypothetical protein
MPLTCEDMHLPGEHTVVVADHDHSPATAASFGSSARACSQASKARPGSLQMIHACQCDVPVVEQQFCWWLPGQGVLQGEEATLQGDCPKGIC